MEAFRQGEEDEDGDDADEDGGGRGTKVVGVEFVVDDDDVPKVG